MYHITQNDEINWCEVGRIKQIQLHRILTQNSLTLPPKIMNSPFDITKLLSPSTMVMDVG